MSRYEHGPDHGRRAPTGPGLQHIVSAPSVPPTAMGQHPGPQYQYPPPPPPHMLQSPPAPIHTGVGGHIPPRLAHAATLPTPVPVYPPPHHHHHPPGPHQHHHDSFAPPARRSSAALRYTPTAAQINSPPGIAYTPIPAPLPPPSAAGHQVFHPPPPQYPYSPPSSAHGQPQPYNAYAPLAQTQSQPLSPQTVKPRIPTLAELEGRPPVEPPRSDSRHRRRSGSHSRPSSRNDRHRPGKDSNQGDKSGGKRAHMKSKAAYALGHEGVMDTTELGLEGVVKAAASL